MDLGLKLFTIIISLFLFTVIGLDFMKASDFNNESFDLIRNSQQNTFIELENEIETNEEISEIQLYEKWLTSFIENISLNFHQYELGFEIVNTDPEVILVRIRGYDDSIYITEQITSELISGILIEDY